MLVYYAHCAALYNSHQEKRDLETLALLGFEVLNPNAPEHQAGYVKDGMMYFERLVTECGALTFRALPDGRIPAGVFNEINVAMGAALPVFELPHNLLTRGMSVEATREYLNEVGYR